MITERPHRLVARVQALPVGVEAVGVFHVEFTDPHKSTPGTRLVPELGVDLVEDQGQVSVAVDVGLYHIGQQLFVRGGYNQRALPAVRQLEQIRAVGLGAARPVP
jgi:hypothetical protein